MWSQGHADTEHGTCPESEVALSPGGRLMKISVLKQDYLWSERDNCEGSEGITSVCEQCESDVSHGPTDGTYVHSAVPSQSLEQSDKVTYCHYVFQNWTNPFSSKSVTEIPRGAAQISAQMLQMYNVIHTWQKNRQIMNITPQCRSVIALKMCSKKEGTLCRSFKKESVYSIKADLTAVSVCTSSCADADTWISRPKPYYCNAIGVNHCWFSVSH